MLTGCPSEKDSIIEMIGPGLGLDINRTSITHIGDFGITSLSKWCSNSECYSSTKDQGWRVLKKPTSEAWFDYNKSKIETISAGIVTANFNREIQRIYSDKIGWFDARAFNIPKEEVSNYFLWRAKDWERNSVSMLCGHYYSHKEMHGKGRADQHEMLYKKGINWNDLNSQLKNGTFISKENSCITNIKPTYEEINSLIETLGV